MSNSGTLRIQNSRDARAELRVENNERFLNYFRFLVKTGARDEQNRLSRTFCCFVKGASMFFIGILIDGVAGRAVTATIAIEVFAVWVVFVLGSVELMCNVNGIGSTAQRISIKNGNCDQLTRDAFLLCHSKSPSNDRNAQLGKSIADGDYHRLRCSLFCRRNQGSLLWKINKGLGKTTCRMCFRMNQCHLLAPHSATDDFFFSGKTEN